MKLIRSLIIIFLLVTHVNTRAVASDNEGQYSWMTASFSVLSQFMSCIKVPQFVDTNTKTINIYDSKGWVKTGIHVDKDKLLKIDLLSQSLKTSTKKYRVMYRIDPRFEKPQIFIQKYDFASGRYEADFPDSSGSSQTDPTVKEYKDYFGSDKRHKIQVRKGDIINITLGDKDNYFSGSSEMGHGDDPLSVYTHSSMNDNTIIYTNNNTWCKGITNIVENTDVEKTKAEKKAEKDYKKEMNDYYNKHCKNDVYYDLDDNWRTLEGRIDNKLFEQHKSFIKRCPDDVHDDESGYRNNPSLCFYDKGRGMEIKVGGKVIKDSSTEFIQSPYSRKYFFYSQSDSDEVLDFTTDWGINGMYKADVVNLDLQALKENPKMEYLHFGRYFMDIEIGGADIFSNKGSVENMEYKINDGKTQQIGLDFEGNAYESGYLSLHRTDDLIGTVKVNVTNYVGSNWFSTTLHESFIKPFRESINKVSRQIYKNLTNDSSLSKISKTALVLYVIIYALTFLAGAVKITMMDLIMRIVKISIIVAVFSEEGWKFLNEDLFNFFIGGTDYLLTSIVGVTSHVSSSDDGNIFGFIDPIFNKFVNHPEIWGLLLIQFLQIQTGLTFMAIMTIYSLMIYCSAVLGVVIRYCLCFLGIAVMMSMLPFFIILMLFERTKSIFDNWISIMFSYMMQPTLLLIFFLLIDQIINEQIAQVLLEACWDTLVKIDIVLDPRALGIPVSLPGAPYHVPLPFFPGIPFFVPQVNSIESIDNFSGNGTVAMVATSSFLLFALCKLANGLVEYVSSVVELLTNVRAGRQDGKLQDNSDPVKDITSSFSKITKPIGNKYRGVKSFAKKKLLRGEIEYTEFKEGKDIKYDKKGGHK